MSECERTERMAGGLPEIDEEHLRECRDCRDATVVHRFFRRLAAADDLSPSLPDPRMIILKADLVRRRTEIEADSGRARAASVAVWLTIAVMWLIVLTWKFGEVQQLFAKYSILSALPGGAASTALLAATIGGLLAFTIFAVAVHSILAEM